MSGPSKKAAIAAAHKFVEAEPPSRTDEGNAERIARVVAGDMFWVPEWKTWMFWRGDKWDARTDEHVVQRALDVLRRIPEEVSFYEDPDEQQKHLRFAANSLNSNKVMAAVQLARAHPELLSRPGDFDNEPYLLNCLNGTLDLRSGNLRKHRRDDMLTQRVNCSFDPKARSKDWQKVVSDALGGSGELISYLQRVLGYCLTGAVDEEKFFFLLGVPGAGKGTIIESFAGMMGDYARSMSSKTLGRGIPQGGGGASEDVARLKGARFVYASEFNRGERLDEAFVNTITGGDTITARFLYQSAFEFLPEFKLFLSANHHPRLGGGPMSGIWRRVQVIPFEHRPTKVDMKLKVRLRSEEARMGILAWAVEGCLAWQEQGLGDPPEKVEEAKTEYQQESDSFAVFIGEAIVSTPNSKVLVSDMFAAYQAWATASGVRPVGKQALGRILKERGLEPTTKEVTQQGKRKGARAWKNVDLRPGVRGDVRKVGKR